MTIVADISIQSLQESTTKIVVAYISHHQTSIDALPRIIASVGASLQQIGNPPVAEAHVALVPAVPVKKSISNDFIVCLEDGAKLRTLTRYLKSRYQLTPEAYRRRWGLPADYPMLAPGYSALRSELAKKSGLGRPKPVEAPARGRRKTKKS